MNTEKSIRLLKSINFEDSTLFGLSVDIFKVRLLVSVIQTGGLQEFGFDRDGVFAENLEFSFRRIRNLKLQAAKGEFGPPYLKDGELAALDFGPVIQRFSLTRAGSTAMTDRIGVYREMVDIHEVLLDFGNGSIEFAFSDLTVTQFFPETLDE